METKKIEKDELSFGNQKIGLEIPKFTNVLIVTTISEATNGGINVSTITYDKEDIESFLEGEKKQTEQ